MPGARKERSSEREEAVANEDMGSPKMNVKPQPVAMYPKTSGAFREPKSNIGAKELNTSKKSNQPNFKNCQGILNRHYKKRRYTNGRKAHKKMLNIMSHQEMQLKPCDTTSFNH